MDDDHQETGDPTSEEAAAGLDGALEAAYGMARKDVPTDASVLIQLERQGVRPPHVMLRDAEEDEAPVVRPGTREVPGGRYQTVGEVARGGVGVILKCRDVDLGRDVAMKVLRGAHADNVQLTERFVEEAQIGGQLQHPGIVPVYELGLTEEKRPYFTMKFVKGDTLAALLSGREDASHEHGRLLGIFQQVCMTVGYAHSRGVIHRDLKPANVIVGAFGEVMTVDWGFAKVLAHGGVADEKKSSRARREPERTIVHTLRSGSEPGSGSDSLAGSIMGTPGYMPPEQALGDVDAMDARSDVFGLGAILCEILTGLPPYPPDEISPIVQAAQARLGNAFDRLDASGADDALISLCKRCLDANPAQRPADAGRVGRAVSDHLQAVENRAHEAHVAAVTARRTRKWAVAAAIALLVGLGASLVAWREADTQRARAESTHADLEARNDDLEVVAYASALRRASDAIAAGDLAEVPGILDETDPRKRGFEYDWLRMQAMKPPPPRVIDTGGGIVEVVELSPDASEVAVADRENRVSAWDLASRERLWRVEDLGHSIAWAPDGSVVAALHLDGRLTVVDAKDGSERRRATVRAPALRLAMSHDGTRLALTSLGGWVSVLRMDTLELEHEYEVDSDVREICMSPDGAQVLVTMARSAVILDAASGEQGHAFSMKRGDGPRPGESARPLSVDWSPAGDRVLVCFVGGRSGIWFSQTGLLDQELETHSMRWITGWWAASSGRFCGPAAAITLGADNLVRMHSVESGTRRALIGAYGGGLIDARKQGARWGGPGTRLVTWGTGGRLFVSDVSSLAPGVDIVDAAIGSNVVSSPDERALFYVTRQGDLVRRHRKTGRIEWSQPVHKAGQRMLVAYDGCRFLPKSGAVAVVNSEMELILVDAESGDVKSRVQAPEALVTACAAKWLYPMGLDLSADESRLACAVGTISVGRDMAFPAPLLVYDLQPEPQVRFVGVQQGTATDVCFVPGTDHVVSCGASSAVRVWDAALGTTWGEEPVPVRTLSASGGYSNAVAVSPDGARAAVGRLDGWVNLYEVSTGRPATPSGALRLHESVGSVSFDAGTGRLLALGERGSIQLFDTEGRSLLRTSLGFARPRSYTVAADWSYLLAVPHEGRTIHVRSLRLPRDLAATHPRGPDVDEGVLERGSTAASEAWRSSTSPDEARERLVADPDLPDDVRSAALALVRHLPYNIAEIVRRLRRIEQGDGITDSDSATVHDLARMGVAASQPGGFTHGTFLALLSALRIGESMKKGADLSAPEARQAMLAEAILSALYGPSEFPRTHSSLWRAVIAAWRGEHDRAEKFMESGKAAFLAGDKPLPALWTDLRALIDALRAR